MSPMPNNYYALPTGPAAKYCGVKPETVTHFRKLERFQQATMHEGYWFFTFQDLECLTESMREYEAALQAKREARYGARDQAETEAEDAPADEEIQIDFKDGASMKVASCKVELGDQWIHFLREGDRMNAVVAADQIRSITRVAK